MRLQILILLVLTISCTKTAPDTQETATEPRKEDTFEARLETVAKQALTDRTACDAWAAELRKRAGALKGDVEIQDEQTALAVLEQLEKRPQPSAAARELGQLLLTAPESADRARIGAAAEKVQLGCELMTAWGHLRTLLEKGEELGLADEQQKRVRAAAKAFLDAEGSYPGTMVHTGIVIGLLENMNNAGALEIDDQQLATLKQEYEKARQELLSRPVKPGIQKPSDDIAGFGAAVLLETKKSNELRLAAMKLVP